MEGRLCSSIHARSPTYWNRRRWPASSPTLPARGPPSRSGMLLAEAPPEERAVSDRATADGLELQGSLRELAWVASEAWCLAPLRDHKTGRSGYRAGLDEPHRC